MVQDSILDEQLSISDVQDLIDQERLLRKGALKIHYAIDHHEISEYCFPLGFHELEHMNLNLEQMIDRQATLQHLFQKHRVIFFEEYNAELDKLYDFTDFTLRKHIDNEVHLLLSHLSNQTNHNYGLSPNEQEKREANRQLYLERVVNDQLPLLLAICFGFANKGIEKLQRLDNERLLFGYDDVKIYKEQNAKEGQSWPPYIAEFMKTSKPGALADELLRELTNDPDNRPNRSLRSEQNLRTDCRVMARVITINERLYQEYLNQKKIKGEKAEWHFIQLISSDTVFTKIANTDAYKKNLFSEDGVKLKPYKSLAQRYLWMLCDGEDDSRLTELTNFSKYKEAEENKKKAVSSLKVWTNELKVNNNFLDDFNERIKTVRKTYENTGLLSNYKVSIVEGSKSPVQQLLQRFQNHAHKEAKTKNAYDSQGKTRELYEEFLKFIHENINSVSNNIDVLRKNKLWHSAELRQESSFQNRLLNGLKTLKVKLDTSQSQFVIHRGEDKVQGSFQHLPIAFNVSDIHLVTLKKSIDNFLLLSLDKVRIRNLINYLLDPNYNLMSDDDGGVDDQKGRLVAYLPRYEDKLIRSIIILLMPRLPEDNRPDEDLYYWVMEIVKRLEKDLDQNAIPESEKNVRIEFYYLAAWLARRLKKYDESANHAKEGRSHRKNDVRFIHAECLIHYCKALDAIGDTITSNKDLSSKIIHSLTSCLALAIEALDLLDSDYYQEYKIPVKPYLKASLRNTAAYVAVLLSQHDRVHEDEYLQTAKTYLDYLKKFKIESTFSQTLIGDPSLLPRYNAYPEFLHTEASYCLERAKRATQPNEFAGFKEKGLSAINAALNLRKNLPKSLDSDSINKPDIYEELCKKLEALDWAKVPHTSTSTVVPSPE